MRLIESGVSPHEVPKRMPAITQDEINLWFFKVKVKLNLIGEPWPFYDDPEAAAKRLRNTLRRIKKGELSYMEALKERQEHVQEATSTTLDAESNPSNQNEQPNGEAAEDENNGEGDDPRPHGEEEWDWNKGYVYVEHQDQYIFRLTCQNGLPYIIEGDRLRRIVERYSNYNGNKAAWTINQLCTEEGMPRPVFKEIKTKLGFTHDSPPRLPEDFTKEKPADMAIADVQRAKNTWATAYQQESRRVLRKYAQKWWHYEDNMEDVVAGMEGWAANYSLPEIHIPSGGGRGALVFPMHDLHYGKYASELEVGERYDRSIAEERALSATEHHLTKATRQCDIEEIHAVVGTSDYMHVDMDSPPSSTAGTPQDTDGTIGDIILGGQKLMVQIIDMLRSVAPVTVYFCPGNHDRMSSIHMHRFGQAWYRDTEEVTFTNNLRPFQYFTYHDNTGCFFHGDVRKSQLKSLGNIISEDVGFNKHTTAISGHKHFMQAEDVSGLMMHQCLSLSGSDRWHKRQLYAGKQGMQSFVWTPEAPAAIIPYYV